MLTVQLDDETLRTVAFPPGFKKPIGESVKRVTVDFRDSLAALTLNTGEVLQVELPGASGAATARRPIVYLDQNHWIEVARHVRGSPRATPKLKDAAETLVRLAREQAIRLPVASGHFSELAGHGMRRRDVAVTMLQISRGWQMRSPLQVRARELQSCLSKAEPAGASDVFTLEPTAMYSASSEDQERFGDLPPALRDAMRAMVGWHATVEAVLEDCEPGERRQALSVAARWAKPHADLSAFMRKQGSPPPHFDLNAHALMLADLREDLGRTALEVGMTSGAFDAWLKDSGQDDIGRLPFLGLLREATAHRLRNADSKWLPGDLMDMHFVGCALAYADIVICEKDAADYLGRSLRSLERKGRITQHLEVGVDWVRSSVG